MIQFHDCLGQCEECRERVPALNYHTGSGFYHKFKEYIFSNTIKWLVFIQQQLQQYIT